MELDDGRDRYFTEPYGVPYIMSLNEIFSSSIIYIIGEI